MLSVAPKICNFKTIKTYKLYVLVIQLYIYYMIIYIETETHWSQFPKPYSVFQAI